jgi:transposase
VVVERNPKLQGEKVTYLKRLVVMTEKERDQIAIFENVKQNVMSQKEAGSILGISYRQVKRRYKRYLALGPDGLIHKSRGKQSNKGVEPNIKEKMLELLKSKFKGFGPTFVAEKLLELYKIKISNESVRKFMISNGFWEAKKEKTKSKHIWRERKHSLGELVQLDGSKHIWFNNQYYTLIAFIDDATGRIMHAQFALEETIKDIALSTKAYFKQHGRPLKIYTDRGKVFKVNKGENRGLTQYQYMLKELNVELIHAYSPQAKGRVERLFKTCQDRLEKELRLQEITTIEKANTYLQNVYIPSHNAKFAVLPRNSADLHRSTEGYDFNTIFSIKHSRTLKEDNTIVYKHRWFQLDKKQPIKLKRDEKITIIINFDQTIQLMARETLLAFKEIPKELPREQRKREEKQVKVRSYNQSPSHPWRIWQETPKKGHF